MKRRIVGAAIAAMLTMAQLPGAASAAMPGTLDQNVDVAGSPTVTMLDPGQTLSQTFTAGVDGLLTRVDLHCGSVSGPVNVTLFAFGLLEGTVSCYNQEWVEFDFKQSAAMNAGDSGLLQIQAGGYSALLGRAASDYAGGSADIDGAPTPDIAFRTYMMPMETMSNTWSPGSVNQGASTPASLTSVISFPVVDLTGPLTGPVGYEVELESLPSWFTPSGVSCTGVTGLVCDLTTLQTFPGITWTGDGSGPTLTLQIDGTAAPGAGDGTEAAGFYVCFFANSDGVTTVPPAMPPSADQNVGGCILTEAALSVNEAAPTAPPTSTVSEPSPSEPGLPLWLLPAVLAFVAASFVGIRLGVRRRR